MGKCTRLSSSLQWGDWELALSCGYLRTMQRNYLGCDVVFAGALLCVASGEEIAGSYPESELIV